MKRRSAILSAALSALALSLSAPAQQAGFFQLVEYPLRASALANERFFALERYAATMERDPVGARRFAAQAVRADHRLKALTARYNAGRWAGILAEEPADGLWASYRQQAPLLPAAGLGGSATDALADLARAVADLASVATAAASATLPVTAAQGWRRIPGLGRGDGVLSAQHPGATLALQAQAHTGPSCLRVHVLPIYPAETAGGWQAELLVDGQPLPLHWPRGTQRPAWQVSPARQAPPSVLQLGDGIGAQWPAWQKFDLQSSLLLQVLPSSHRVQEPPQSMSLSELFFEPSPQ